MSQAKCFAEFTSINNKTARGINIHTANTALRRCPVLAALLMQVQLLLWLLPLPP
jgi:hypothetical protein